MLGPLAAPELMPNATDQAHAQAGTLVAAPGSGQHVARVALELAENDFITGTCLPLDGGRSIFAGFEQYAPARHHGDK